MSLFNQLVYRVLILEIIVYLITLLPFSYIPVHTKKIMFIKLRKFTESQFFIWTYRFVALFMMAVLADSAMKSYNMSKETTPIIHDSMLNTTAQVKRFYTQRNFYMSLFAVFMLIVLNNRFDLIFKNLQLNSKLNEMTGKYTIVKKHNEKLVAEYANSATCAEEMNKKYNAEGLLDEEAKLETPDDSGSAGGTRNRKKGNSPSKASD